MIIQSQKKKEKNVHKNQGYHSNKIRVVKFDSSFFLTLLTYVCNFQDPNNVVARMWLPVKII